MCVCGMGPLELVSTANGHHLETDLAKRITIEQHASIKHERRLIHRVVHCAPVNVAELFPFGRDDDCLTVLRSRESSLGDCNLFFD